MSLSSPWSPTPPSRTAQQALSGAAPLTPGSSRPGVGMSITAGPPSSALTSTLIRAPRAGTGGRPCPSPRGAGHMQDMLAGLMGCLQGTSGPAGLMPSQVLVTVCSPPNKNLCDLRQLRVRNSVYRNRSPALGCCLGSVVPPQPLPQLRAAVSESGLADSAPVAPGKGTERRAAMGLSPCDSHTPPLQEQPLPEPAQGTWGQRSSRRTSAALRGAPAAGKEPRPSAGNAGPVPVELSEAGTHAAAHLHFQRQETCLNSASERLGDYLRQHWDRVQSLPDSRPGARQVLGERQ